MKNTFFCIDGHTAGNPVRLVVGGAPLLHGAGMAERRLDFLARFDWIRTGLCFEPRGHDMMSGGFLYPPTRDDTDVGILFMETSGCLPMCGHGTIGIVTFGIEHGLIVPRREGALKVEVPAGIIDIEYAVEGNKVAWVRIRNVAAYVAASGVRIHVPGFGSIVTDIVYGGNYYAIIEPQGPYIGLDDLGASRLKELSRTIRAQLQAVCDPVHPLDPRIHGVSHVLWADRPRSEGADGRNAVFYGEAGIDRSPCGTGTSARLAHLVWQGRLKPGDRFVHESYIGSRFVGRVESLTELNGTPAIIPSIQGSAIATGFNTIWVDQADVFAAGFSVT
ncbi:MAG: 4-hydroxyproline epimerase [Alphaproteobacteria bacterium]|nr:4-hydroxyproline epimerase [Alphaproteobacteria bacterium]MDE2112240.1 4-hydroxyproline epimerase [Alphaproteobacteria bacterium]MDE2494172.1 4-hydroxyproline epimerase [Alphaproteobacteria bacterium]